MQTKWKIFGIISFVQYYNFNRTTVG